MSSPHPFHGLLSRLESTDPARALREGWYVSPPSGAGGEAIVRHFRSNPVACLMLLGAIGVGKTTALLAAADALSSDNEGIVHYVDAPLYESAERPRPGLLLRLAGLLTLKYRKAAGALRAVDRIDAEILHAGLSADDAAELLDEAAATADNLPSPGARELEAIVSRLGAGVHGWSTRRRVLLIDGIDLTDDAGSLDAWIDDLDALRRLGFGVCLAGSIGWRYTLSPELLERFDRLVTWPPLSPELDPVDREFLCEVLQRRIGGVTFTREAITEVVMKSGGVMRDLIVIARRAVEEASLQASHVVAPEHVAQAVAELGRERQLVLDGPALEAARRFLDDDDVALRGERIADLLRRAVLLPIDTNQQRFRVHPALAPLLRAREAA